MATIDRALNILRLFAGEQAEWSVEAAAEKLGLSQSTAYQYFRSLVQAELLSTYKTGIYVVGPAIIELDRQARRRDPIFLAAQEEMDRLHNIISEQDNFVLLCRLYKQTVMCIDQRIPSSPNQSVSYERGRPMPLERGAASKVILANLAPRTLRKYYDQINEQGTSPTWQQFRKPLLKIRNEGVCITHGELDAGKTGISAPVFGANGEIAGSIGLVLSDMKVVEISPVLVKVVIQAGKTVTARVDGIIKSNNTASF